MWSNTIRRRPGRSGRRCCYRCCSCCMLFYNYIYIYIYIYTYIIVKKLVDLLRRWDLFPRKLIICFVNMIPRSTFSRKLTSCCFDNLIFSFGRLSVSKKVNYLVRKYDLFKIWFILRIYIFASKSFKTKSNILFFPN